MKIYFLRKILGKLYFSDLTHLLVPMLVRLSLGVQLKLTNFHWATNALSWAEQKTSQSSSKTQSPFLTLDPSLFETIWSQTTACPACSSKIRQQGRTTAARFSSWVKWWHMLAEISVSKFWIEILMEIFQILYLSLYCIEKYYKIWWKLI